MGYNIGQMFYNDSGPPLSQKSLVIIIIVIVIPILIAVTITITTTTTIITIVNVVMAYASAFQRKDSLSTEGQLFKGRTAFQRKDSRLPRVHSCVRIVRVE
jgi:hypothetical protein